MPSFSPPAPLLCVLLCVSVALQRSDLRLAYVTQNSFSYYSCTQDPQPCSIPSLTDCRCKDIQPSTLQRPHSPSSPVFRMKRLTVWFTSPSNTALVLNNSEVRHLTLIHCGVGGPRAAPSLSPLDGYFAVQHLERLTVVNELQKALQNSPEVNKGRSSASNNDPEGGNGAHLDSNRYIRDTHTKQDLVMDLNEDYSPQTQDLFLGRELGAAYHEQARLGVIHSSILEWGAVVKAYTVQTHINNNGVLPFPKLYLPKLPETSVIYVSFVY